MAKKECYTVNILKSSDSEVLESEEFIELLGKFNGYNIPNVDESRFLGSIGFLANIDRVMFSLEAEKILDVENGQEPIEVDEEYFEREEEG